MEINALTSSGSELLRSAVILRLEGDDIVVTEGAGGTEEIVCSLIQSIEVPSLALAPLDVVLYWRPDPQVPQGVILGRIGLSHAQAKPPDELVIEAKKNLTLKCGEGSITIREDGKILIKGKDLVSHAQRMNRIKGGSVSIN